MSAFAPKTSRTARVAVNTVTSWVRFMVSMGVLFLLTPMIIAHVGTDDFGLWALIMSIAGFFSLLEFGLGPAVVKYVAECHAREQTERRNRILSTLLIVYLIIALGAAATISVLSMWLNPILSIPPEQQDKALALFWILGLRAVLIGLPLGLFKGALFGEQRIHLLNGVQAACTLLYGIMAWLALSGGCGIVALAWISSGAFTLEHLLYVRLAYTKISDLRLSLGLAERRLLRETVTFSLSVFAIQVAALVLLRTDPIIVKLFLPLSAVAVYAIALKIAEQVHLLLKQFVNVLTPLVSEFWCRREMDKIRFVLVNCTKFTLGAAVMLAVATATHAESALVLWLGPEFGAAAPILLILTLATAASIPQLTATAVLNMTGHHVRSAAAAVLSTALNIALSIALVYPLGLLGIALATLLTTLLVDVFVVLRYSCTVFELRYRDYLRGTVEPVALPGAVQLAAGLGLQAWLPPSSLFSLSLEVFGTCVLFLIVFWNFALSPAEKNLIGTLIPRPQPSHSRGEMEVS